jgi:tryptophanyl-tRNA synthetase
VTLTDARKRVFSGIQPTGVPHLGNYLGAIRHWVSLQEEHEAFYCIVDLHALTMPWEPKTLARQTLEVGASLMACGVDPKRSVLFIQSHVAAHTELAWILTCVARMGELRRMIQFRERSRGDTETVGVGLFTYPVLQAADVLAYRAHGVPVGEDQRQHLELMRDLAGRFNAAFGETFVVPEAWIPPAGARIMALDDPTQKMSKSARRPAASILLSDPPDVIARKIRAAVTDSGREVRAAPDKPALTNLLTIYSLVAGCPRGELQERFAGRGYGEFKMALAEQLIDSLAPLRTRLHELMSAPDETARALARGAQKAREASAPVLADVRERIGLSSERASEPRLQRQAGEEPVGGPPADRSPRPASGGRAAAGAELDSD